MKKLITLNVIILLSVSIALAQKSKTTTQPAATTPQTQAAKTEQQPSVNPIGEHFARKYAIANRWNDSDIARSALYDLIAEYPGSDSLIFSLALIYYEEQKFASAVLVGQDLLARTPKNAQVLELVAVGYEGLNIADRALQNYESLYLLTGKSVTLYKMAFLQYGLKRYQETITNVDILLGKPEAETTKVTFNDATGKPKEYLMKVALLNLKGLAYKDQGDKVNAKKFLDQSLALAPDFKPAKDNLADLK